VARQRFIWPNLWTDPIIGRLKPIELLFYIGCFSNADDDGRILGDPAYLRSTIFPYQDISLRRMKAISDTVTERCSSLDSYEVDGVPYLAFRNWREWQKPKYPSPSKLPPPPWESSGNDSGNLPPELPKDSPTGRAGQGRDGFKGSPSTSTETRAASDERGESLEHAVHRLLLTLTDKDSQTPRVVASLAARLSPASVEKVRESVLTNAPRSKTAYAIGALKSEIDERELHLAERQAV
jgi:hypothetical protein